VKEEEGEMFPQALKAKIDWAVLHAEVLKRKEQLMAASCQGIAVFDIYGGCAAPMSEIHI
jgi:hypothetical protein